MSPNETRFWLSIGVSCFGVLLTSVVTLLLILLLSSMSKMNRTLTRIEDVLRRRRRDGDEY